MKRTRWVTLVLSVLAGCSGSEFSANPNVGPDFDAAADVSQVAPGDAGGNATDRSAPDTTSGDASSTDVSQDSSSDARADSPVDAIQPGDTAAPDAAVLAPHCHDVGLREPESIRAIQKSSDVVFLGTYSLRSNGAKLITVEITNPKQPKVLSVFKNFTSTYGIHDMTFWNRNVFVGQRMGALTWIDVADPANPRRVFETASSGYIFRGMQVGGGYLFYSVHATICPPCVNGGLEIYDVTASGAGASLVASLKGEGAMGQPIGFDGNELQVTSDGMWAYILDVMNKSLVVIDVHDRRAPRKVQTVSNVADSNSTADNSLALLADRYLFVAGGTVGLGLYDVLNKSVAPKLRARLPFQAMTIAVESKRKELIATGANGTSSCGDEIRVFDLSNIDDPNFIPVLKATYRNTKMKWVVADGTLVLGAGSVPCDVTCGATCPGIDESNTPYSDKATGVNLGELCILER